MKGESYSPKTPCIFDNFARDNHHFSEGVRMTAYTSLLLLSLVIIQSIRGIQRVAHVTPS